VKLGTRGVSVALARGSFAQKNTATVPQQLDGTFETFRRPSARDWLQSGPPASLAKWSLTRATRSGNAGQADTSPFAACL
jgi:hypothetical protein